MVEHFSRISYGKLFFFFSIFSLSIGRGLRYDGGMDEHSRKRLQAEVQRMEKISLQHVQDLLHRIEEVIGLWRLLVDHQFHILAGSMSQVLTVIGICLSDPSIVSSFFFQILNENRSFSQFSKAFPEVFNIQDLQS